MKSSFQMEFCIPKNAIFNKNGSCAFEPSPSIQLGQSQGWLFHVLSCNYRLKISHYSCQAEYWPLKVQDLNLLWCWSIWFQVYTMWTLEVDQLQNTIAAMPSLLCRLQILVWWELEQSIPTVVHTVPELLLWTKGIEWSHPSTISSYSALRLWSQKWAS